MIDVTALADEIGITALAASARSVTRGLGGDGDAAGLLVRLVGDDARNRLAGGEEEPKLIMQVESLGTEVSIVMRDRGAPVVGPPETLLALLALGVASRVDARHEFNGNVIEVRMALPQYHSIVEGTNIEVLAGDVELSTEEVVMRPLAKGDAEALTQGIYRCYGWTYPNPDFYYPDRIEASLAAGKRIGYVAVSPSGEMVAHWGAVWIGPSIVETGGTFTDPRFRRRGLAGKLGDSLLLKLREIGVEGRLREPVLTHPATQHIAIQDGATFVGVRLHDHAPFQQVGITDGLLTSRASLTVAYSSLQPLEPKTVWVPAAYEAFLVRILDGTDWSRTLGAGVAKQTWPEQSRLASSYDTDEQVGEITVEVIGADLCDVLDATITQYRHSGAEVIRVNIPANDPALPVVGAGLPELGLGFSVYVPGLLETGDALIVEWLHDSEIDTSIFNYADERVETLTKMVVAQAGDVGMLGARQRRRASRRAQLFSGLAGLEAESLQ